MTGKAHRAKHFFRAWGQDPRRPGRTFERHADAVAWAQAEAPLSHGYAFVENTKTGHVETFSDRTASSAEGI